jgi:hypothetical protein
MNDGKDRFLSKEIKEGIRTNQAKANATLKEMKEKLMASRNKNQQ